MDLPWFDDPAGLTFKVLLLPEHEKASESPSEIAQQWMQNRKKGKIIFTKRYNYLWNLLLHDRVVTTGIDGLQRGLHYSKFTSINDQRLLLP